MLGVEMRTTTVGDSNIQNILESVQKSKIKFCYDADNSDFFDNSSFRAKASLLTLVCGEFSPSDTVSGTTKSNINVHCVATVDFFQTEDNFQRSAYL